MCSTSGMKGWIATPFFLCEVAQMSDNALPTLDLALRGRRCDVQRLEHGWTLGFGDGHALTIEAPWRIVQDGRIAFADSDDGQMFGLPQPIEGEARSNQLLGGRHVALLEVDHDTADIRLYFDDGTRLDIFNRSCGYEGWQASFRTAEQNVSIIGMGGGGLTIARQPVHAFHKS